MSLTAIQLLGATLFALAVVHTFSVRYFERLAHRHPAHRGVFHFLGEIEVVFGFWALVLVVCLFGVEGKAATIAYLEGRSFTEPLFVFVVMVIAASRPVVTLASRIVQGVARGRPQVLYALLLGVVPLMGSLITEPAAMTLAAMLLREHFLSRPVSVRFKYATLGVLFVNVSIGGALTAYAAPPVLMVAAAWQWDSLYMMRTFGWRAALAVAINAIAVTWLFRRQLRLAASEPPSARQSNAQRGDAMPLTIIVASVMFLVAVVAFAHHPVIFIGVFCFFLGFASAYETWQDRLILREALLVAFFLGGLVVLGAQQQWWLQPLLAALSPDAAFFGTTALTAVTDNAALTYLASLVPGLSDEFKYMVVAGAITGGGLTVIANAPNPAGYSILRECFDDAAIGAGGLLLAALAPTAVAVACFWGLR
ncbi:MAG TPA: putative Na+/H+ antiporter [Pseudomonadales bacterium]|nr:putative Na+/H+ antiporter [Pseudomonadales bacterium]